MQIVLSNQHTRFMSQFYLWLHLPDKEELSATKVNQRTSNIPCKFPEKPQSWYQVNMLWSCFLGDGGCFFFIYLLPPYFREINFWRQWQIDLYCFLVNCILKAARHNSLTQSQISSPPTDLWDFLPLRSSRNSPLFKRFLSSVFGDQEKAYIWIKNKRIKWSACDNAGETGILRLGLWQTGQDIKK